MTASKIVIVGAGVMGQGLAEAIATAGTEVTLIDRTTKLAEQGIKGISESIDREIERWGLTQSDKRAILARINSSSDLSQASDAEIVIEAIPEELERKRSLFAKLDSICDPETVFITNTATLSISEIGASTERPGKIIGMHFLNPVTRIPVVEIVKGLRTEDTTFEKAVQIADVLDKKWITVNEYPAT